MKKILVWLSLVILIASFAYAHGGEYGVDHFLEEMDELEGQVVGSPLDLFLKDDNINFYFETDDGTSYTYGVDLEGGIVNSVSDSALEDVDYDLYISQAFVDKEFCGVKSLKEALNSGELGYKAYGLLSNIELQFIKFVLTLTPGEDCDEVSVDEVIEAIVEESEDESSGEGSDEEGSEEASDEGSDEEGSEEASDEGSDEESSEEAGDEESETEEEVTGEVHTVNFVEDDIFSTYDLTIKLGDTVNFVNTRDDLEAMLIGAQGHTEIRSEMLEPGESYSWTFVEVDRYVLVDAIMPNGVLEIHVEE